MGRGLSPLQQTMLLLGLRYVEGGGRGAEASEGARQWELRWGLQQRYLRELGREDLAAEWERQKAPLAAAAAANGDREPDVAYAEVYAAAYGWVDPAVPDGDAVLPRHRSCAPPDDGPSASSGPDHVAAVRVAVSRAAARLVARGLAMRLWGADRSGRWAGIVLTRQGLEVARALSVKTEDPERIGPPS